MTKVILPATTSRELYVDLCGGDDVFQGEYGSGAAVTVEDAVDDEIFARKGFAPGVCGRRIEGKAYYK